MDDLFYRYAVLPDLPFKKILWRLIKNIQIIICLIALFLSPLLVILGLVYFPLRFIYRSTYNYFKTMRSESALFKLIRFGARNIYVYVCLVKSLQSRIRVQFISDITHGLVIFADLLLILCRFNMAAAMYLKLINRGTASEEIYFKNMMASYFSGNAPRAFDAAKTLLNIYPKDYDAALLLAHLSVKAKYEYQASALLLSINNSYSVALAAILLSNLGEVERVSELLVNFSRQEPVYAESAAEYLLFKVGNRPAALAAFKAALDFMPTRALLLKRALALGPGELNVEAALQDIRLALDDLLLNLIPIDNSTYFDSLSSILVHGRCLVNLVFIYYFGGANLDILKKIAKMSLKFFPPIDSTTPQNPIKILSKPQRIKYGFFAEFANEHAADFWTNLLNPLPRDLFEVVLFIPKHLNAKQCSIRLLDMADKIIRFPYYMKNVPIIDVSKAYGEKALPIARELVAAESLDIFHNPFCSSDIISQYLAFSRLALVQITDGNALSTSGLPEIDYKLMTSYGFMSEPDEWFSEKLALLRGANEMLEKQLTPFEKNLPGNIPRDHKSSLPSFKRNDFDLPEERPFYLCIQDLDRRHPETDVLFAELLKRDQDAFLAISSYESYVGNLCFFNSFKRNLTKYGLKRVNDRIFLAPLFFNRPKHEYLAFLKLADCHLVYRRFPGGGSYLDALGQGLPLISWPTDDYNGYLPLYRLLGLEELLAKNQDEYIELAMRMAHDKKWATDLQRRLRIGKARYLRYSQKNDFFRQDLSQFLQMAVERARGGQPPAHWHGGRFYDHLSGSHLKEFIRAEQDVILSGD